MYAWEGLLAEGYPEMALSYFSPAHAPEEFIALAWVLENGSGEFYAAMADRSKEQDAKDLFRKLCSAEEHHKAELMALHAELTGREAGEGFPGNLGADEDAGHYMEGGMRIEEALQWVKQKDLKDVLELCLGLETNAYDRYLFMRRHMDDVRCKRVFDHLSREEKDHLDRLVELFDTLL
jgi:rubrerythrin